MSITYSSFLKSLTVKKTNLCNKNCLNFAIKLTQNPQFFRHFLNFKIILFCLLLNACNPFNTNIQVTSGGGTSRINFSEIDDSGSILKVKVHNRTAIKINQNPSQNIAKSIQEKLGSSGYNVSDQNRQANALLEININYFGELNKITTDNIKRIWAYNNITYRHDSRKKNYDNQGNGASFAIADEGIIAGQDAGQLGSNKAQVPVSASHNSGYDKNMNYILGASIGAGIGTLISGGSASIILGSASIGSLILGNNDQFTKPFDSSYLLKIEVKLTTSEDGKSIVEWTNGRDCQKESMSDGNDNSKGIYCKGSRKERVKLIEEIDEIDLIIETKYGVNNEGNMAKIRAIIEERILGMVG
jgi:hypothetical protein